MLSWELRHLPPPPLVPMLPDEESSGQPEAELSPRQKGLTELESSPFGSGTSPPMDSRSSSSAFEAGIASSSISSERESGSCASIPREDGMCFFLPLVVQKHSLGACTVANPSAGISRVSGVTARNVIRIACVSRALRFVVILGITFHVLPVQHILASFRVLR